MNIGMRKKKMSPLGTSFGPIILRIQKMADQVQLKIIFKPGPQGSDFLSSIKLANFPHTKCVQICSEHYSCRLESSGL